MWESTECCILVSFCCFVPRVLARGSLDSGQNLVNTLITSSKAATFPSHSRVFLPGGAGLLISCIVFLLRLCAQLAQQRELPEEADQVTPLLPSSILCARLGAREMLVPCCVAWINIRGFKLPFSWLGSSWACVSPALECLRLCADSGEPSKRTGRE